MNRLGSFKALGEVFNHIRGEIFVLSQNFLYVADSL